MIAGYKATDLPRIPEVIVVFADKILRGCRTRKMSASAWTGFNIPNAPPLGEIGEHVRIFENQIRPAPPSDLELELNRTLTEDVLDISLYPGLKPEHLGSILGLQNVSGVVLRTYGSGNAPDDPPFLNALKLAMEDGNKTVVNITQCPQGTVEMGLYEASLGLLDVGVVSGLDMTPEAALTKLMVTMGSKIGDQVKLQMQINQRGEQSKNLFDLSFAPPQKAEARTAFSSNVTPDRRFDPGALSSATIRIKGFTITKANQGGKIYVYMNFPRAGLDEKTEERTKETIRNDTRCLFAIEAAVANEEPRYVVEFLEKIRVKNIIGQGDIVLTFLPTKGVEYSCEKITLSLFTQA
jgi:L-asparaginase